MRKIVASFVLVLVGLMMLGTTDAFAKEKMKKQMKAVKMQDLKWEQEKDAPPGLMAADIWGNRHTGAYGGYSKFPAGAKFPLHYHTNGFQGIVISGSIAAIGEDGTRNEGHAGDYFSVPAGHRHTTEVGPDGATFFEWSSQKAGMKLLEEKEKK